jgi:hypothetical protein
MKAFSSEELAARIFRISVLGIAVWVAASFYFVILAG